MTEKKTFSSSEADSVNRCLRAHYWAYGEGLEKIDKAKPLQVGSALHEFLEEYYLFLMKYHRDDYNGPEYYEVIEDIELNKFQKMLVESRYKGEHIIAARDAFTRYVDEVDPWEWEIIAVEDYIEYQLSDNVLINGVIDVVARLKKLPKKDMEKHGDLIGKLVVIDHKSCYNFYTYKEYKLNSQLPKYQFAANKLMKYGEPIEAVIINQVRTREDAKEKYTRTILRPSEIRQIKIVDQHLKAAEARLELKNLPLDQWRDKAQMTLIKDVCRYCDFFVLCDLELDDAKESQIRSFMLGEYKKRDTSYRDNRKANVNAS